MDFSLPKDERDFSDGSAYGRSTPGGDSPLPLGVNSIPQIGNMDFAINSGNAQANTVVSLFMSNQQLTTPKYIHVVEVWIELAAPIVAVASSPAVRRDNRAIP